MPSPNPPSLRARRPLRAALAVTGALLALGVVPRATSAAGAASTPSSAPSTAASTKGAPAPKPPAATTSASAAASASASIAASASASASAVVVAAPRVSIGYARLVRGDALPRGIDSVMQALVPAVDRCFERAIAARDDGDAYIDLRLEVVGPGVVAAADVSGSHDASDVLRACVRDLFDDAHVGASGPAPVVADVNISFTRDVAPTHVRAASACGDVCDGDISDDLRDEVFAQASAATKCFKRRAAPGEPTTLPAGRTEVLMRIAADGSVCGAATAGDGFGRPSLTTCLLETLSIQYRAKPGGCVDVQVPIVFRGR